MNLFEKLNRLDDSLVESKRVVKKKKLAESVKDVNRRKKFLKDVFTKWEILDLAEAHDDFTGRTYKEAFNYVLNNWDNFYFEDEYEAFCENELDDDIDEMLKESTEQYELSTLVKDSINHLVNDLGKDSMADDFGDAVCADLENNYDIDVPQNPVKYADWCDAVMSEVSRQLNNKEEQLTEGNNVSSQLSPAIDSFLQDIAQMYGTITYKDIMEHIYTEEDLKKLKNYRRRFNAEIPYEGDEEADAILNNIAEKVARLIKSTALTEGITDKFEQDINRIFTEHPELKSIKYNTSFTNSGICINFEDSKDATIQRALNRLEKEGYNITFPNREFDGCIIVTK